ncbi:DUF6804 family protein [Brevibacterium casei]|uniref:DUF6804 family protein n=1 Tax=Brevibacterium casei TaxID=33889 RepID=UPI0036FB1454
MGRALERARSISEYLVLITGCPQSEIRVHPFNGEQNAAIEWHVVNEGPVLARISVWFDGHKLEAQGQIYDPEVGFTTLGQGTIASVTHTDDEIARKIVVNAVDLVTFLRRMAADEGIAETTDLMNRTVKRLSGALQFWGAGSTAKYERPSPHLGETPMHRQATITRPAITVLLIGSGLALIGALPLPYGYYQFLRWALTIVGAYLIYCAVKYGPKVWATFGIVLIILFLPSVLVVFPAAVWKVIDVVVAITLIVAAFSITSNRSQDDNIQH